MESSTIQKYKFREHSDGVMVGGISIKQPNEQIMTGGGKLGDYSIPVGLYVSPFGEIKGGSNQIISKTILGGTIDDGLFEKLYNDVAKNINKKTSRTKKNNK